ncbi:MAG TPA: alkaline phosphatase family protein, partial [Chthoniobacterales bacterium]
AVTVSGKARNAVIFVTDGLRPSSVNRTDSPTLFFIRQNGVNFVNSHSLFPTFTTPNASALATGHYLGDTGDFGNTVYSAFPVAPSGGTVTPFLENDAVLTCVDDHFGGNYLSEETLLAYARARGYNTAAIGKLGPVAIQDASQLASVNGVVAVPTTIILDDSTGKAGGTPLSPGIEQALAAAQLPLVAPDRSNGQSATSPGSNGFSGNNATPGTRSANLVQQQYFVDATTKAILPTFQRNGKPFLIVFWSRDPDGTQHNQGDSLNALTPGINGSTSRDAVGNADHNLKQLLDYLSSVPGLADDTDLFVTSDHGFSTISRHEVEASGEHYCGSYSAGFTYKDATGRQEVNANFLPPGFVAIDVAHHLGLPLFDPDKRTTASNGTATYLPVDPTIGKATASAEQHPANGNGLIGASGAIVTTSDAQVVVAANGGSDLIYLPKKDQTLVENLVDFFTRQDYVSGLFVDPAYGAVNGALPLSAIDLKGSAQLPTPALVVNFRSFALDAASPLRTGVTVCDTGLQEGQGMHGSFSRADTFNNMAAYGPDFKRGYVDEAPVSNVDVPLTLADVLGFTLPANGSLIGRPLCEALMNGPDCVPYRRSASASAKAANGERTWLFYQSVGETKYFDAAGFAHRTVGLPTLDRKDREALPGFWDAEVDLDVP